MTWMYELWDWDTANLIRNYDDEAAALETVARYVAANGREAVETWTLLRSSLDRLTVETVAEGAALADLALRARAGAA